MYILGIDIGTSKIAGVLLSADENHVYKVCAEPNHADIPSSHSWEKRQDPERIIETATQIIGELKQAAGGIASIGISGQMHGFLYVDAEGRALGPLYTWQDARAAQPLALKNAAGRTALEEIERQTGQTICAGYALATHYYNCLAGLQPKRPYRMISIGAYLGMRLCKVSKACIDPSEAASFGLYSVEKRDFLRKEIIQIWGESDFLPDLVPFYHRVGYEADGIAVFQSLGDNQASFYGALRGLNEPEPGALLLNLGTGGQLSFWECDSKPGEQPDKDGQPGRDSLPGWERRPYPSLMRPGANLLVGATMAGGKAFALLVDLFADILSFFGRPLDRAAIYAALNRLASEPAEERSASADPLKVAPYFYGTRSEPDLCGQIGQINADNLKAVPLIQAFAEAISSELKELFLSAVRAGYFADVAKSEGQKNGLRMIASGNAIRRNPIIRSRIELDFATDLLISELKEEAACGAAWYAWEALQNAQRA